MISDKKHIQQLAAILHAKVIEDIVISPGSRSGPMVHTFAGSKKFNCRSIIDERSAAYFALGMAQAKQKPVVLVCSSGTAALNFAPAVAEAFYLNVPLIVLTADRPDYWVNQGENQTISQSGIYRNFCKKYITLPLGESEKELWFAGRIINETINIAVSDNPGPVHINIPLEEPLHNLRDAELPEVKIIESAETDSVLTENELQKSAEVFNKSEKVLILAGQQVHVSFLERTVASFSEKTNSVVLKEHLSNLNHPRFTGSADLLISSVNADEAELFRPDLLISFGGTFVSKVLKSFLRNNKPENHWHLSLSDQYYDTYQSLTKVISSDAAGFFNRLSEYVKPKADIFFNRWKERENRVNQVRDNYISQISFTDLKVFEIIKDEIPENSVIHLGNSSPVRYAMICNPVKNGECFGNRGVSGIDGSLSAAAGFASCSEKMNTVILGDLSFFYDSNALWNRYIGDNLRIIVIHNGGGNLFGMIDGPSESPAYNEFFFTENRYSAKNIAKTFGLDYYTADNKTNLKQQLMQLWSENQKKAAILEIFTDAELNTKTYRGLFKAVKTGN